MYKKCLVLFLSVVVVVKSQVNNSSARVDDYINSNRGQYAKNIKVYDLQMETFKLKYAARINTIDIQRNMVEDSLLQSDARLNPLEVLSDFSKNCVVKYRPLIPTISSVKTTIKSCMTTATNQVTSLLSYPLSTRNTLLSYYTVNYERDITNCQKTHVNSTFNYTICVTSVSSTANIYTINNQKTFTTQLEASQCTANANIKKALRCSFSAQNRTISLIAEANTLINRCIQGLDDCSPCSQNNSNYSCSDLKYVPKSHVDYYNSAMQNPFLGLNQTTDCLMLKIY